MRNTNRRDLLRLGLGLVTIPGTMLSIGCSGSDETPTTDGPVPDQPAPENDETTPPISNETSMQIQYLEIVTPDAEAVCKTYSSVHGLTFGDPEPSFGNARTAKLTGGGMIGVRQPMRETESPVVRPYALVTDIKAAVDAAEAAGATIAMPPTPIPGHGTFAIFIQGGIESGVWQV